MSPEGSKKVRQVCKKDKRQKGGTAIGTEMGKDGFVWEGKLGNTQIGYSVAILERICIRIWFDLEFV